MLPFPSQCDEVSTPPQDGPLRGETRGEGEEKRKNQEVEI